MGWVSPENYAKAGFCPKCLGQGWEPGFFDPSEEVACVGCNGTGRVEPYRPPVGSWECPHCGKPREDGAITPCPRCDRDVPAVQVGGDDER